MRARRSLGFGGARYGAVLVWIAAGLAACGSETGASKVDQEGPASGQDAGSAGTRGSSDAAEHDAPDEADPPPPPLDPTTRCDTNIAFTPPIADCAAVPVPTTLQIPLQSGVWGEVPVLGAAEVIGGTLYASFSIGSCFKSCISESGLFRTRNGLDWEEVLPDGSGILLAVRDPDLYWLDWNTSDPTPIHHVRTDTLAAGPAGVVPFKWVSGLALGEGWLFTLSAPDGWARTTLERRAIAAGGSLGAAERLREVRGIAGDLHSNGELLAWGQAENPALVVTDLAGVPRHVAALTAAESWVAIGERAAVATSGTGTNGSALCALDLATGAARVLVAPRPLISICSVATSSSHVFWTQSSAPNVYCDQVWTMPLDGGAPRVLACNVGSSISKPPVVLASDQAVYWIGAEVSRLDAASL